MKYLASSALALVFATGAAFAESHVTGDDTMTDDTTTMQTDEATTQAEDGTLQTDDGMAMNDRAYTSDDMWNDRANLIRTRDITGGNIYTMNAADDEGWDMNQEWNEVGADWNDIGEIEDIVLSRDGQMTGIVAEIGGFLDIGDKHVVISLDDVNLVAVDDQSYAFVTRMSEEELEALNDVDEAFWN